MFKELNLYNIKFIRILSHLKRCILHKFMKMCVFLIIEVRRAIILAFQQWLSNIKHAFKISLWRLRFYTRLLKPFVNGGSIRYMESNGSDAILVFEATCLWTMFFLNVKECAGKVLNNVECKYMIKNDKPFFMISQNCLIYWVYRNYKIDRKSLEYKD